MLLTVHFHVSYECLETLQIWQDAERVIDYINAHDNMPMILAGDLNIRNESMAVKIIREKLTQHSESFQNTLCRSIHPLFQKNINHPGLGIDHIFTKDIAVSSCKIRDVEISDHLPLVLDFSL
jgi:endonuclease/exonuclease/phosphatase (EEP) superfamily protein YafD